jgi:hypothetical protein
MPSQGNLLEQILVRDILEKTELKQEDIQRIDLQILGDGVVKWTEDQEFEIEVEMSQNEIRFMKDRVEKMNKENQISQNNLFLCLKFKDLKNEEKPKK